MNALLSHQWGRSRAQDRVWAQVTGLAPRKAVGRLLMVLQAFIDDSYTAGGVFVLGGHIATAENWVAFTRDWEPMVRRFGTLAPNDAWHFKMSSMAANSSRMSRLPGFFRIIEKHVLVSLSCKIDVADLRRAKERVYVPQLGAIGWGFLDNAYLTTFKCLLDMFHAFRSVQLADVLPDEPVDFIFDNQTEKKFILAAWDDYVAVRPPGIRDLYGATPRFEDDQDFLPLQAADFWAWWVREWWEAGTPEKMATCDFGSGWGALRSWRREAISFNEDQLFTAISGHIKSLLPDDRPVYDLKATPEAKGRDW